MWEKVGTSIRNKQMVANRTVRNALAKDYGMDLPHQSPLPIHGDPGNKSFSVSNMLDRACTALM